MAESAVKDVEETICKNALRELYEAMENLSNAIGEAMALIADAFSQTVRPVLDSIMNLISLRRNLNGIGCTVGVRRPIHRNDAEYGMWLSYDALNALAPAIHDACMLCGKSPSEQRRCPLRAALREMPIDVVAENDEAGKCPYFGGI